tara:strand:+ start:333 stop:539 length:207 start_codon:yes stop_codon:yes gene_type:complete
MFEAGDLVYDKRHPDIQGYILEVLNGRMSGSPYMEIRWLNFPWGSPHTLTLELPSDIAVLAKGNKNGK